MTTTSVAMFLAREMGLENPLFECGEVCFVHAPGVWRKFSPHTDRAQFAEVLLWAAKEKLHVVIYTSGPSVFWKTNARELGAALTEIDASEDFIAATLMAIAKARGYEE